MQQPPLHPTGDRQNLAGDVARQGVRGQVDDCRGDVLRPGDDVIVFAMPEAIPEIEALFD